MQGECCSLSETVRVKPDHFLVVQDDANDRTEEGVYVPSAEAENVGTIVRVGPFDRCPDSIRGWVVEGARVRWAHGLRSELEIDGVVYQLMHFMDVAVWL